MYLTGKKTTISFTVTFTVFWLLLHSIYKTFFRQITACHQSCNFAVFIVFFFKYYCAVC